MIPEPDPKIMVRRASRKVVFASIPSQIRYTGIRKFVPEMPAEMAGTAMIIPTGKR